MDEEQVYQEAEDFLRRLRWADTCATLAYLRQRAAAPVKEDQ